MTTNSKSIAKLSKAELLGMLEKLTASEEQFRYLTEGAPVILWMADGSATTTFVNRRLLQFTGFKPGVDKEEEVWVKALHPDDRDECMASWMAAHSEHRSMELLYRLRRHDGEYRWMQDIGNPYYAPDGRFLGYIGASTDITERRRAEDAMRRSHEELAANNRNITLLGLLNDQLQVCLNMTEIKAVIAQHVPKLFSASAGAICMINESRSLVESVVAWGDPVGFEPVFTQQDCWALRQGKPHGRTSADEGLTCAHLSESPDNGFICVPMTAHGEVLGLLHLQAPVSTQQMKQGLSAEALRRLAITTAEHLALGLSSFKLRDALRVQSVRDPLTQLFNRRYLLESLERELSRSRRKNAKLGVLMIDVDHFKRYNDTYGHHGGDAVLQEVGKYLRNSVRTEDIACRYGGEEFTLVMPEAPTEVILQRAEEIRKGVSELRFDVRGERLGGITISIGVAIAPIHADNTTDLLGLADQALYRAKREGRNRVCVAGDAIEAATAEQAPA